MYGTIRMLELRENARFTNKSRSKFLARIRRIENFECDAAMKFSIFGSIDNAHAAARDKFAQLVARPERSERSARRRSALVVQKFHFGVSPKRAFVSRANSLHFRRTRASGALRCAKFTARPCDLVIHVRGGMPWARASPHTKYFLRHRDRTTRKEQTLFACCALRRKFLILPRRMRKGCESIPFQRNLE